LRLPAADFFLLASAAALDAMIAERLRSSADSFFCAREATVPAKQNSGWDFFLLLPYERDITP
jgi:hypothetical protein